MVMRRNPQTGLMEDDGTTATGTRTPPAGAPADATGGANPTNRNTVQPATQTSGGQQQQPAAQPRQRTAPPPWVGGGATIPPPPPPLPGPSAAPNFGAALSGLGTPTKGPSYTPGVSMAPAQMGPQYQTAAGAWQGEELLPDLTAFSRNLLQNYNPLNSGYGAAAREGANANLRKMETDQTKGLEEFMASRGLTGSSVETDGMVANSESLRRTALDEETRIMELIASMDLAGRDSAAGIGLGVGQFGQSLGADRRDEGRYGYEADRTRGRDFEDDTRFRAGFAEDQNRYGFESEYRSGRDLVGDQFNRAGMEMDAAGMEGDADLNRYLADLEAKRMAETGIMDRAQLGLDQDDLAQRSWRDNAGVTADYDRMAQDDEQFGADSAFRDRELGQNQSQYEGDSAFRDRELDAKTRAEEDKLLADIIDGGIGEITPEMAGWIKEKFGIDLPVGGGDDPAPDPASPTTNGVYKIQPTAPPAGKSAGDGRWNKGPMGWIWTDDKQDWWNPGDWLD